MTKEEILQQCTVEGNVVKLPNMILDRKAYLDVKKTLEMIEAMTDSVFKTITNYLNCSSKEFNRDDVIKLYKASL